MTHSPPQQPKFGVGMWIAAWGILIVLLVLYFQEYLAERNNPNRTPASEITAAGQRIVRLEPNRGHHYVVTGKVNGQSVQLLLDTGATDVVVPEPIAARLDLEHGPGFWAQTANGRTRVYTTEIPELSIGPIRLHNVRASISPTFESDTILLGMSALRQLDFSQEGGELILRQRI